MGDDQRRPITADQVERQAISLRCVLDIHHERLAALSQSLARANTRDDHDAAVAGALSSESVDLLLSSLQKEIMMVLKGRVGRGLLHQRLWWSARSIQLLAAANRIRGVHGAPDLAFVRSQATLPAWFGQKRSHDHLDLCRARLQRLEERVSRTPVLRQHWARRLQQARLAEAATLSLGAIATRFNDIADVERSLRRSLEPADEQLSTLEEVASDLTSHLDACRQRLEIARAKQRVGTMLKHDLARTEKLADELGAVSTRWTQMQTQTRALVNDQLRLLQSFATDLEYGRSNINVIMDSIPSFDEHRDRSQALLLRDAVSRQVEEVVAMNTVCEHETVEIVSKIQGEMGAVRAVHERLIGHTQRHAARLQQYQGNVWFGKEELDLMSSSHYQPR